MTDLSSPLAILTTLNLSLLFLLWTSVITKRLLPEGAKCHPHLNSALGGILGCQALSAVISFLFWGKSPTALKIFNMSAAGVDSLIAVSFYLDRLSLLMLSFISFVGLVVFRFSIRYLNGEHTREQFLARLILAVCAAQLLVISGNLFLFGASWIALSLCLHHLLEHYSDRGRAIISARKKFIISRIGDLALWSAILLIAREFRTLDFSSLFDAVNGAVSTHLELAALAIAFAALCKSAQLPFHSWLPDTLEAPTPVSALMHAGIVNGGGYAVIRLSPLFEHAPAALNMLVIFGALTASTGLLVMWTQTTVKKSLAWSTVSQMGCMILQCGLGAFGLALIHILGHGFYKAHAFLLSGTASKNLQPKSPAGSARALVATFLLSLLLSAGALFAVTDLFEMSLSSWPGGIVSLSVVVLGLSQLCGPKNIQSLSEFGMRIALGTFILALTLTLDLVSHSYFGAGFATVTALEMRSEFGRTASWIIIGFFSLLAIFSTALPLLQRNRIIFALFTHATNGFYLGLYADRFVRAVWPQREPQKRHVS